MVRVKIDNRIRTLTENAINTGHRGLFVIVGERSRDQVVTLYHILTKSHIKTRPSVLWCYKKELGFSTHRKKRMRQLEKMKKSGINVNEDNPFELFLAAANVRWCYYNETHRILGQTFGMVVLQDFEAMQPNILARTIETVEGGGLVIILLNTLNSLKQLYTMSMDVHARYRTESHQDVVSRFNERFLLSLMDCKASCIIDDKFNILPICSHILDLKPELKQDFSATDPELLKLRESIANKQPLESLVALCRTVDQANAVIKFTEALSKKTVRSTISLTAARGRGKSAALGLSIASAIAHGFSNIYVTSPTPENLHTLFEFVIKGLEAVHLTEHHDYNIIRSLDQDHNKAIIRINVFKDHNQTIQYIDPIEASQNKLSIQLANLFVIDEAAAIPLPIVKSFLGCHLVFLSSTVNGYEGTGRSLSLKLLNQLRQNTATSNSNDQLMSSRLLDELVLEEPIRYRANDPVEKWLNNLLCLDATICELPWHSGCPVPDDCQLYYINRDTLFSYHKTSEEFLHHLMALYVASHYKNTPNDLQMISDAPAHHLFCLLPPSRKKTQQLPEVLCFVQICLEGEISRESIMNSLVRGKRPAAGDLIPWTVSRQFNDDNFASLSGARVVRIATNPNYQKMGYGSRALQLIQDYYSGKCDVTLDEQTDKMDISESEQSGKKSKKKDRTSNGVANEAEVDNDSATDGEDSKFEPRTDLPPLLMSLDERKAEKLDYIGVSFGLTQELFKFWKRNGYVPIYLRQTASDLTGEHSCIMLKRLGIDEDEAPKTTDGVDQGSEGKRDVEEDWLSAFHDEFRGDFFEFLVHQFREFSPNLSLSILRSKNTKKLLDAPELTRQELCRFFLTSRKLGILELYSKSLSDYHQIVPLLLRLSKLYFLDWLPSNVDLSAVQACILLCMGVQGRNVDQTAKVLSLEPTQVLGLFNRAIRKITTYLRSIEERAIEIELESLQPTQKELPDLEPLRQSLADELNQAAKKIDKDNKKEIKKASKLSSKYFENFTIKDDDHEWDKALKSDPGKSILSVPKKKVVAEVNALVSDVPIEKVNLKSKIKRKIHKKIDKKFKNNSIKEKKKFQKKIRST